MIYLLAAVISAMLAFAAALRFALRPCPSRLDAASTGLPVEGISLASPSGARLAGWFLPGALGAGGILLLHGVRSNRACHVARMRFLREAGYSTLAIDFQAHGESPGARITLGVLESLDARGALAWLGERLPGEKLGVIGISLGGAAALLGPEPLGADALVLESVFPDIASALRNRLRLAFGAVGAALTPLVLAAAPFIIVRLHPERLRPIGAIGRFRGAVLLISGTTERKTTIEETRALFASAGRGATLWEIAGATHEDLYDFAGAAYRERILTFFQSSLRRAI